MKVLIHWSNDGETGTIRKRKSGVRPQSGEERYHVFDPTKAPDASSKKELIEKVRRLQDRNQIIQVESNHARKSLTDKLVSERAARRKANRRADEAEAKLREIKKMIGVDA